MSDGADDLCLKIIVNMYFSDDDVDISWLTQVPSLENNIPVFDLRSGVVDTEGFFGNDCDNIVSLEEDGEPRGTQVLYDNVVCEPISSDDEVDNM